MVETCIFTLIKEPIPAKLAYGILAEFLVLINIKIKKQGMKV